MEDITSKAEQAIYNTMISRGDKLQKRVLGDSGVTLHFEGSVGFQEKSVKYIIEISEDNPIKEP